MLTSTNLPPEITSFVGRVRELGEAKELLSGSNTRLLTLAGPGGCGKTRLAMRVARELEGSFADGVWWVELASLFEPELVPQRVARTLGVSEDPGPPLIELISSYLGSRKALLVLDNCEHLIEACAELVENVLRTCPAVSILTTSREAFRIPGEVVRLVPPLSLPDPDHQPTLEELNETEAARLFYERASAAFSGFVMNEEDAPALALLCRRLDGIPLALELAAARVGMLTVAQITDRLEDRFGLLTRGGRTAPPRQQTLRATMDWGYDLLSDAEKVLFGRLSVFAGGFSLEEVEEVCAGDGIEQWEVLDLLSSLADKSLVLVREQDGAVRYGMLQTVRRYAGEKLKASGEDHVFRERHADFFLKLSEESESALRSGWEESFWLQRLETEHDNLRTALSFSLEAGRPGHGLRLVKALGAFWELQEYFTEGRRWIEEALSQGGGEATDARATALRDLAWFAYLQGDFERAERACAESLRLDGVEFFRDAGGGSIAASLRTILGAVAGLARRNLERAEALFEESLELSRRVGDTRGTVITLTYLGSGAAEMGDQERANELFEESLAMCRELGDRRLLARALINMGYTAVLRGDHERATELCEEAVAILRERGNATPLRASLDTLGWAALLRGDYERSRAIHRENLNMSREVDDKLGVTYALYGLACVEGINGEAKRAARLWGAASAIGETVGYAESPRERALREPYLAPIRGRIGEAVFEQAQQEGSAMPQDAAIEYALSVPSQDSSAPKTAEHVSAKPPSILSVRELEVLKLVAEGLTDSQVAERLYLSPRTVSQHLRSVYRKLEVPSRAAAVSKANETGLI